MAETGVREWLLASDEPEPEGYYESEHDATEHKHVQPWWKVMCLTGLDYFSTLGYQPGIAALAAGAIAPVATLVLVIITLFAALPMYRRVAEESPHGDGSISMLERLLSYWPSKLLVLALIGFVSTGFMITMTLSAADAAAHLVENPFLHEALDGKQVIVTLGMLLVLGAVFMKGFKEAIGIAVVLVSIYLALSAVVVVEALASIATHPTVLGDWTQTISLQHAVPFGVIGAALLVFPALALGLSGFETGVVVMPLVKGDASDSPANPLGRIRNAKKLLTSAALIMSVMLLCSSLATTVLIPAAEFQEGGEANGRALAYLAHERLGEGFGTIYDVSTICILWFAGASAMAGLLNIVPRYLPRYGMAPDWARLTRPLTLVFTLVGAIVTILFQADVNHQAGAYATGVLSLMTSAAFAVALTEFRRGKRGRAIFFGVVSLIFTYTITLTIIERPEGLVIALIFIVMILVVSLYSRVSRSTELRVDRVVVDDCAKALLETAMVDPRPVRFIANKLNAGDTDEYDEKMAEVQVDNHLADHENRIFLEVEITDASEFETMVEVTSVQVGKHRILRARGSSVPNAIAAFLLHVRDVDAEVPHVYFEWSERAPGQNALRFLLAGEGDIPPLTHEILRKAEPDEARRPQVHVGG